MGRSRHSTTRCRSDWASDWTGRQRLEESSTLRYPLGPPTGGPFFFGPREVAMARYVSTIAGLLLIATAVPAAMQQLADERTRREALVYYRAGQELMTAERFEQAAEQFQ